MLSWLWNHHGIGHGVGDCTKRSEPTLDSHFMLTLWTGMIIAVRRHLLRRHRAWTSRGAGGRRRGSPVRSMWHVMGRSYKFMSVLC